MSEASSDKWGMENNIINVQDYWVDIKDVAEIKGLKSTRALRLNKDKYIFRKKQVKGGTTFELLLSSLESEIQEKFLQKYYNRISFNETEVSSPLMVIEPKEELIVPEIAKTIALAKFDLLNIWQEFTKGKNKAIANKEFLELYNTGMYAENIFKILGTTSFGSLHRWKRKVKTGGDYTALISRSYNLNGEFKTTLTDLEKNILMKLLLNPSQFSISKAISMTIYILQKQGYEQFPAPITFKRYVDWFKKNNYDKWVLAREGEKALKDKVEPFLVRDAKILNVFDVLVADGHKLNFEVINPFTGRPTRATLIGFLDWRLYIDTDMVINTDIQCLYDMNLQNKPIGAVPYLFEYVEEKNDKWGKRIKQKLKINSINKYFNAGLMILDCEYFRKNNITKNLIEKTTELAEIIECPDQDIFNVIFENNYLELDYKYNVLVDLTEELNSKKLNNLMDSQDYILHYTGGNNMRPWLNSKCICGNVFWEYAKATPFYDDLRWKLLFVELEKNTNIFNFASNKKKYLYYKLMSKITFGKTKEKYKQKQVEYKKKITEK